MTGVMSFTASFLKCDGKDSRRQGFMTSRTQQQRQGICPVAISRQHIWDIIAFYLKVFDQHPQGCCTLCRNICKELAPSAQRLCESFGIPDHLIAAPIATNWVDYNKVDNQGEMYGSIFR